MAAIKARRVHLRPTRVETLSRTLHRRLDFAQSDMYRSARSRHDYAQVRLSAHP